MDELRGQPELQCSFRGIITDVLPNLSLEDVVEKLIESAEETFAEGEKQVPTFFAFFEKTVEIFHIVDGRGNWRTEVMPNAFTAYVAKRRPEKVAFVAQGIMQQLSGGMNKSFERGALGLDQIPAQKTLTIFVESETEYIHLRHHIKEGRDGGPSLGELISYASSKEASPTKRPDFTFFDKLPARAVYH